MRKFVLIIPVIALIFSVIVYFVKPESNQSDNLSEDLKDTTATTLSALQIGFQPQNNSNKVVHLTFDDGPSAETTPLILDLLDEYGIKATWFITGRQVQAHPELVKRIIANGHAVANHTYSHPVLPLLDKSQISAELASTQTLISNLTGYSPSCYRPPFGETDPIVDSIASEMNLTGWLWDIDTRDWSSNISQQYVEDSMSTATNISPSFGTEGVIILLHDGGGETRIKTYEALRSWLKNNANNYSFSPIKSCLAEGTQQNVSPPDVSSYPQQSTPDPQEVAPKNPNAKGLQSKDDTISRGKANKGRKS